MHPMVKLTADEALKVSWDNRKFCYDVSITDTTIGKITRYPSYSAFTVKMTDQVFYILYFTDDSRSELMLEPTFRMVRRLRVLRAEDLLGLKRDILRILLSGEANGFLSASRDELSESEESMIDTYLSDTETWPVIRYNCGETSVMAKTMAVPAL